MATDKGGIEISSKDEKRNGVVIDTTTDAKRMQHGYPAIILIHPRVKAVESNIGPVVSV